MAEKFVPGRKVKFCEPCQKKKKKQSVATVYCKQCGQFQCDECEKAHDMFDLLSGHDIVDADKATEFKGPRPSVKPRVDLKGLDVCVLHGKEFEFYCVKHDSVLCSVCAVEKHRQCPEVNGLTTQISKAKPDPNGVISILGDAKTRASAVVEHVNATKTSLKTQVVNLPAQIDMMKEKVIKMFDTLKESVAKEAYEHESEMSKGLGIAETKCDEIIKDVEGYMETMKNVVDKGSPEQILVVSNVVGKMLEPLINGIDQHESGQFDVSLTVEYSQDLEALVTNVVSLGKLAVRQQKTVKQSGEETPGLPSPKPVTLTLKTAIDVKKTDGDEEEPLYSGLTFLPDGRLVVVDNKNKKCYVMNERLEKLGTYTFQSNPQSVAVISATEIAVSGGTNGGKTLLILSISLKNELKLIRTIQCSSKYDSLSLMNDDTLIAGTYDDKRPVRMISLTGRESDLAGLPQKTYKIDDSWCTYLRKQGVLVFTDSPEHEVRLYDVKANKCEIRCVVKHEDIKEPCAVSTGPSDTVLVCSMDTNAIVQLSLTGVVISTIKVDMKYPRIVCMDHTETKVAVSNACTGAMKLHIYSLK